MQYETNPTSKASLMDRLLSQTFSGDLREVASDPKAVKVKRIKPHVVSLVIGSKEYLLAIHKPKPEEARLRAKERWRKTKGGKTTGKPAKETSGGQGRYDN